MPRPQMPGRIPTRFAVGEKVVFRRTFTDGDVALFIGVTWDVNPYHTDDHFASQTRFGRRIVPGLLTASMATHLGGLWGFLASEMRFEFLKPVYVGDTIRIEGEVTEVDATRRKARIDCRYFNSEGGVVLTGHFVGYPVIGFDDDP